MNLENEVVFVNLGKKLDVIIDISLIILEKRQKSSWKISIIDFLFTIFESILPVTYVRSKRNSWWYTSSSG